MKKNFTKEGIENLKKELHYLEKEKRKEVAEKLKFAASFGDLSENSAYDDAKNEQNILETKIAKIRDTIKNADIIEEKKTNNSVGIGSKVVIKTGKKEESIEIVGGTEADPFSGKISCDSPMGKAILNKNKGDIFTVVTPKGEKKYTITKIS